MSSEARPPDRTRDEESAVGVVATPLESSSDVSEANSTQPLTGPRGSQSADTDIQNNGSATPKLTIKTASGAVWRWIKGPVPPQELRISPIFPNVQAAPLRLLNIVCPKRKHKLAAYIAFISIWMTVFVVVTHYQYFETETDRQYGPTTKLACTNAIW